MIKHCDRHITHLSDTDISFVLFNISSVFRVLLAITQTAQESK
jgi:glutaminase